MTHRRAASVRGVVALGAAFVLVPAMHAGAADLQISAGRVDPPDYPAASTSWSWQRLQRAWGPPTSCEFQEECTNNKSDIAFYPFGLLVMKDRRINYIEVSSTAWSTPQGIRRRSPLSKLPAAYGSGLLPVANQHRAVGRGSGQYRIDPTNYIVVTGGNALGFSMAGGRVSTIITGAVADVRETLAMYGPL